MKTRQEFIDYFHHMQEEDDKCMLGGMALDDVSWNLYDATEKYKLFTKNELAEMFPRLLGHLKGE